MSLFLKGFIIGLAKIIPGVSGAMIAISFSIYDKLIEAVTHFFDNKKENLKNLLLVGSGILVSIVCFSNVIRYLISSNYLVMMMLFIGLIVGGVYNFSKNINYSISNVFIIVFVIILMMVFSFFNIDSNYNVSGLKMDYVMFFIGGVIEVFSSLIPGISGTALLMMIGIYDNILVLIGNMFNVSYVLNNIMIYVSYGAGIFVSFILFCLGISYVLKKYRSLFDTVVLGLSISSVFTYDNGF